MEEFVDYNLSAVNGAPAWGVTYMSTAQAAAFNIPPDATNPTNAPVYPNSVPIPMVYPLPSSDTVIDTPFGLVITSSTQAAAPPLPIGADAAEIEILQNVELLEKNAGITPV